MQKPIPSTITKKEKADPKLLNFEKPETREFLLQEQISPEVKSKKEKFDPQHRTRRKKSNKHINQIEEPIMNTDEVSNNCEAVSCPI
jgi:hypothetical protein